MKYKFSIVFAIGIILGGLGGIFIKEGSNKSALQGCNIATAEMNDMLRECEWGERECKISLNNQIEDNKILTKYFFGGSISGQ